jgi:hypothetical protein
LWRCKSQSQDRLPTWASNKLPSCSFAALTSSNQFSGKKSSRIFQTHEMETREDRMELKANTILK